MEETFNIEKYFTSEDKQSILRQSNVVYIKQIKKLEIKIKEHNARLSKDDTNVSKHLIENLDHQIDFNNINDLAHSHNWRKLLIKETLFNQNQTPSLKIDQSSVSLYLFIT